jgi:3-deoxy-manno-octulosonate cytidylyltransferase (CMP-KDO synthetase)
MENPRAIPKNPVLLIPARLASTRLPNKVLAEIGGKPMIVRVMERARDCGIGPVVIAASDQQIVDAVEKAGGKAVLTDPNLATGSDRIYAALSAIDPDKKFDAVINVQGDEPMLEPHLITEAFDLLKNSAVDIGTLVIKIKNEEELKAPQCVKAVLEIKGGETAGRALYFTRLPAPSGQGPHYRHIGLYAYRREALEKFVKAPQGSLEKSESLEQLRALGMGLRIDAALVDTLSFGIDTPEDLERARRMIGNK